MTLLKNIVKLKLPLLVLFFLSLAVIFYRYLSIPKNTTFDEIEFAKLALLLEKSTYTPYSMYATGHATLYFYIILFSFKIFGVSLFSLRFPSAIFGIINIFLFFFIMKRVFFSKQFPSTFNLYLPSLLSIIFITLRWYFNFARFGFEVTFLLFLELVSLLAILCFLDRQKTKFLIISGLFAGLAYNSYQPGRIFFVIPLFLLIQYIYSDRNLKKNVFNQAHLRKIGSFILPFILLILPLTLYLQIHHDTRFYQQFYPDNHEMTLTEKGDFFIRNIKSTAGIFLLKGDVNGRHNYPNKPALNPILGILFLFGLLISFRNIKKQYNLVFLLWFFISLAPSLVTYPWENPNMLRTFTVIPSVVYFIGLPLSVLNKYFIQQRRFRKVVCLLAVFLILTSSIYELRTYFVHQVKVFEEAFEAERELQTYL